MGEVVADIAQVRSRVRSALPPRLRVLLIDSYGGSARALCSALDKLDIEVIQASTLAANPLVDGRAVPDGLLVCLPIEETLEEQPDTSPRRSDWLTRRERQVLALLVGGASNKQMAKRLSLSPNTVRTHVANLLEKLGVHSRLEAATMAIRRGIVKPDELIDVLNRGDVIRPRFAAAQGTNGRRGS